jgi:hypothetical protein
VQPALDGVAATLVPHLQQDPGGFGRFHRGEAVGDGGGERLLDEDVLAGGGGLFDQVRWLSCEVAMSTPSISGSANRSSSESAWTASELAGERRPARLAPGVATGDGDVGDLPHRLGQHLPPPAESDASESHLLHAPLLIGSDRRSYIR